MVFGVVCRTCTRVLYSVDSLSQQFINILAADDKCCECCSPLQNAQAKWYTRAYLHPSKTNCLYLMSKRIK